MENTSEAKLRIEEYRSVPLVGRGRSVAPEVPEGSEEEVIERGTFTFAIRGDGRMVKIRIVMGEIGVRIPNQKVFHQV